MVSPLLLEPTHVLAAQLREREAMIRDSAAAHARTTARRRAARHARQRAIGSVAAALAAVVAGFRASGTPSTTELCCAA